MLIISRRELLRIGTTMMIGGIIIPSGRYVPAEESLTLTNALGKNIETGFNLYHTLGTPEVLSYAQTQLAVVKQIDLVLPLHIQATFYSSLHNLIGLALQFQRHYKEALQMHTRAYVYASESADPWNITQSLICQGHEYQAFAWHDQAIQVIQEGLHQIEGRTDDEKYLRTRAHLLGCWADNAMSIGEETIAQEKLEAAEALIERVSPGGEFDRASWLQLAGKLALIRGDYYNAIQRCKEALSDLSSDELLRRAFTLIPLAIAYARMRERDASLEVAEKTASILCVLKAPDTNKLFADYVQHDLCELYPRDAQIAKLVARIAPLHLTSS